VVAAKQVSHLPHHSSLLLSLSLIDLLLFPSPRCCISAAVQPDGLTVSTPSASPVVLPGDILSLRGSSVVRLGRGLVQSPDQKVVATRAGLVKQGGNSLLWIDCPHQRYLPIVNESVIGVIIEKFSENYKVDIGGSEAANLSVLAFQGATKRNKPNLEVGTLIYCRIAAVDRDLEPQLSCITTNATSHNKEWVTGEAFFGPLNKGITINTSLHYCRSLLTPTASNSSKQQKKARDEMNVLELCGEFIPYEVAIGLNGRIWIRCDSPLAAILISNAINNSQQMKQKDIQQMVKQLMSSLQS